MRFAFFFLTLIVSFFSKGIAKEHLAYELRVHLDPEKLLVCEEGIFLMTENYGEVSLSNVQYDEKGYYTTCQLTLTCADCHNRLATEQNICDLCGSQELDFIEIGKNHESFTAQALLCEFLNQFSRWDGMTLLSGSAGLDYKADSDGNQSLELSIKESNEARNFQVEVEIGLDRNADGEINVKVELGLDVDW